MINFLKHSMWQLAYMNNNISEEFLSLKVTYHRFNISIADTTFFIYSFWLYLTLRLYCLSS